MEASWSVTASMWEQGSRLPWSARPESPRDATCTSRCEVVAAPSIPSHSWPLGELRSADVIAGGDMATESPNESARADRLRRENDILQAERRQRERASAWGPAGHPVTDVEHDGKRKRSTNRTSSLVPLSMSAAVVGVMTGAIGIVVPPAQADDYPSANDVQ